ncbi:MAG: hypothetical protein LBU57_04015 [Dysgonamonadaceae bacterium]|nr:hypothetical protein [Dysgonamonadaceae bacterium]
MENEVIVDGVTYVRLFFSSTEVLGDISHFWDQFDRQKRDEIRRKMMEHLVEDGYFIRKDDFEKKQRIYWEDELFYEA